jgi:hypothetical protein
VWYKFVSIEIIVWVKFRGSFIIGVEMGDLLVQTQPSFGVTDTLFLALSSFCKMYLDLSQTDSITVG